MGRSYCFFDQITKGNKNLFEFQAISGLPQTLKIPKHSEIAKRLYQSLNPKLPSGVHLKALEVYETIFQKLGVFYIYYS